jgi:hypothetical protein
MHLTVNGPDICTDQYDDLITSSIKNWLQTKSRRKLPNRNKGNKYNLLFYSSDIVFFMAMPFKKNKTGMFVYCITDMTVTLIKNPPKNNSGF